MMSEKEPSPPNDSDWDEEEDDDWGDAPDEDPDSEPTKRFWSLGTVVLTIIIVLLLAGLLSPLYLRSHMGAARVEAINNAKQVGLALLEFEQEFGKFPDESTVEAVLAETGSDLDLSGHSSNALFRQLIAYGIQSEDIFYCKHPSVRTPDNIITPGEALKPGEVGFSYVAGLDSDSNPGLPLLAAPMRAGTTQFYHDPFSGKAVVLRVDLSAKALSIRSSDHRAVFGEGKTVFDPTSGLWPKGHRVDLRHPEGR